MTQPPNPAAQVRARLVASRRSGVPFERAWARALEHVRWPHCTEDRRAWKEILVEHRPVYARAYAREPDPPLAPLALIHPGSMGTPVGTAWVRERRFAGVE